MRSGTCNQRQIIIAVKNEAAISGKHKFKRLAISINPCDHDDFVQLINEKCNFDGNRSPDTMI